MPLEILKSKLHFVKSLYKCVDVEFFLSSHRKKTWSEISSLLQLNHTSSQRKKDVVVFKDHFEKMNQDQFTYSYDSMHVY